MSEPNVQQLTATSVQTSEIIGVVRNTLRLIDPRLVDHGERVAFILREVLSLHPFAVDMPKLMLLSMLHDVGAYKTEEIDRMVEFESGEVWNHAIYGYLFLKNLTPLGEMAEAILYHHMPSAMLASVNSKYALYASLINLADRVDILTLTRGPSCDFEALLSDEMRFDPRLVACFIDANKRLRVAQRLNDGSYACQIGAMVRLLPVETTEVPAYLRMLAYFIDFRSQYTVTHTINTTSISQELARWMGMPKRELDDIYYGALLHDVGKIAIPLSILENPGRLTGREMEIMRTHVNVTDTIISGIVPETVRRIAARHHEKLDGSGYPLGLKAEQLTPSERVVAVADILSALTGRRSYKDEFSRDKTLGILSNMRDSGQLCPIVCRAAIDHYPQIIQALERSRAPILGLYEELMQEYQQLLEQYGA